MVVGGKGDLDNNLVWDLIDILRLLDVILGNPPPPSPYESWAGDMDDDGDHDISNILALVDVVLQT